MKKHKYFTQAEEDDFILRAKIFREIRKTIREKAEIVGLIPKRKKRVRKDMNKLLCEHERVGSKIRQGKAVRNAVKHTPKDLEAWPFGGKEGMKRPHQKDWGTKSFGENLNPLKGWLAKNVGRNWNTVYSELCKTFDMKSTINAHILVHLWQWVKRETVMHDGKVCYLSIGYRAWDNHNKYVPILGSYYDYYVHPISKILFANKLSDKKQKRVNDEKRAKRKKQKDPIFVGQISLGANQNGKFFAVKIEEIWFKVTLKETPLPKKVKKYDHAAKEYVYALCYPSYQSIYLGYEMEKKLIPKGFHCSCKQQLAHKDLVKLGITTK